MNFMFQKSNIHQPQHLNWVLNCIAPETSRAAMFVCVIAWPPSWQGWRNSRKSTKSVGKNSPLIALN